MKVDKILELKFVLEILDYYISWFLLYVCFGEDFI